MAHLHDVRDSDSHYIINPVTMEITNASGEKNTLQLGDHNSEIFTFEIPKVIEGHDMTLCNKIEVHFKNISVSGKEVSADFHKVQDLKAAEDDEGTLVFSWKVSGTATVFAGALNYRILFACVDDEGNYTYKKWTKVFKGITIEDGFENTEHIEKEYSDGFEQFKAEGIALALKKAVESGELNGVGIEGFETESSEEDGGANTVVAILSNGQRLTFLTVYNGSKGEKGEGTTDFNALTNKPIESGVFTDQVKANAAGQSPGVSCLRNSKFVSAEENPTVNGEICWTYE